ncbi:hypothetical protein BVY02_01830, partial [bacterium J17]
MESKTIAQMSQVAEDQQRSNQATPIQETSAGEKFLSVFNEMISGGIKQVSGQFGEVELKVHGVKSNKEIERSDQEIEVEEIDLSDTQGGMGSSVTHTKEVEQEEVEV